MLTYTVDHITSKTIFELIRNSQSFSLEISFQRLYTIAD